MLLRYMLLWCVCWWKDVDANMAVFGSGEAKLMAEKRRRYGDARKDDIRLIIQHLSMKY